MRFIVFVGILVLALGGCASDGVSGPMAIDSLLDVTATARVGSTDDAEESLIVSVSLHNISTSTLKLEVAWYCPVFVRLYDPASSSGTPVYDGGLEGCPRAGPRIVEIAPGAREVLTDVIGLQRLRDLGVTPGRYRAVAIVMSKQIQQEVEAGFVDIP